MHVKRPGAVFGFAVLITTISVMFLSDIAAYAVCAVSGIIGIIAAVLKKKPLRNAAVTVCAASCLAFLSFSLMMNFGYNSVKELAGKTYNITGVAEDFPTLSGDYTTLTIKNCTANGTELNCNITLYGKELADIHPGDTVTLKNAELSGKKKNNNPFFYHSISKKSYFNIFSTGDITITPGSRSGLFYGIKKLRQFCTTKIKTAMSTQTFPLAAALFTGDQSYFSSEFTGNLRTAGASHLFAVSGMHLALWTSILFGTGSSRLRSNRVLSFFGIIFVLFFILFTGKSPSVIRAGIMLIISFVGNIFRRRADGMNSLGIATAISVLINPFIAGNVSFLLSTGATAAIISAQPLTEKRTGYDYSILKSIGSFLYESFVISAAVTIFTLPIVIYFFSSASLLSGISTLICTIPAEGAMLASLLGVLFPAGSALGGFSFFIAEKCCKFILAYAAFAAKLDYFVFPTSSVFALLASVIILASAVTAAIITHKNSKAIMAAVSVSASVFLAVSILATAFTLPTTSIYIPGEKSADILISANGGKSTVIIGGGNTSSAYDIKSQMASSGQTGCDLLIFPKGVRKTADDETNFSPKKILLSDGTFDGDESNTKNTKITYALGQGEQLIYTNDDSFCGCLLTSDNIKIGIVLSGSDSVMPDEYLNTDTLIFRKKPPESVKDYTGKKIYLTSNSAVSENDIKVTDSDSVLIKLEGE